jgi:hypothetical protein
LPTILSGFATGQVATVRITTTDEMLSARPVQVVFPQYIAAWAVALPDGAEAVEVEALDAQGTVIKQVGAPL